MPRAKSPHCKHCGMTLVSNQGIWYTIRYVNGDFAYSAVCEMGTMHEPRSQVVTV